MTVDATWMSLRLRSACPEAPRGAPSGRGRLSSLRGVACYLPGMSAWGRGRGAPTGRKIVSDASFASWWNFRAAPMSRRVAVMAITSSWYEMACVPGHASWIAAAVKPQCGCCGGSMETQAAITTCW